MKLGSLMPREGCFLLLALGLAAPWLVGTLVTKLHLSEGLPDSARDEFREVCEPIVVWIEEEKEHRGEYPRALPREFIDRIREVDLSSRYHVFDRPGREEFFELGIGDYLRDGWVYWYHSPSRDWYLDR